MYIFVIIYIHVYVYIHIYIYIHTYVHFLIGHGRRRQPRAAAHVLAHSS